MKGAVEIAPHDGVYVIGEGSFEGFESGDLRSRASVGGDICVDDLEGKVQVGATRGEFDGQEVAI